MTYYKYSSKYKYYYPLLNEVIRPKFPIRYFVLNHAMPIFQQRSDQIYFETLGILCPWLRHQAAPPPFPPYGQWFKIGTNTVSIQAPFSQTNSRRVYAATSSPYVALTTAFFVVVPPLYRTNISILFDNHPQPLIRQNHQICHLPSPGRLKAVFQAAYPENPENPSGQGTNQSRYPWGCRQFTRIGSAFELLEFLLANLYSFP